MEPAGTTTVAETTTVTTSIPEGTVLEARPGPGGVIVETAGAERPVTVRPMRAGKISSAQERWSGGVINTAVEPVAP